MCMDPAWPCMPLSARLPAYAVSSRASRRLAALKARARNDGHATGITARRHAAGAPASRTAALVTTNEGCSSAARHVVGQVCTCQQHRGAAVGCQRAAHTIRGRVGGQEGVGAHHGQLTAADGLQVECAREGGDRQGSAQWLWTVRMTRAAVVSTASQATQHDPPTRTPRPAAPGWRRRPAARCCPATMCWQP